MSITSAIVRELMAAGLEGEGLVAALERIEAASQPALTKRQLRDRRYYENHREEKIAKVQARQSKPAVGDGKSDGNDGNRNDHQNDGNDGNDGNSIGNDGNPTVVQRSPRDNNSTPKTSLSANAPREGDAPDGAPALPTKSKPARRRPRVIADETPIDPDRKPDDRDREFAAERGLTGKTAWHEWEAFVAYHLKNGSLMVDWHGAWRTWVLRWKKRNEEGGQHGQNGSHNGRIYPAARPEGTAARVASLMGYGSEPDVHGPEEERRLPDRDAWPKGRHASSFLDAEPDTAGVYRA